MRNWFFTGLAFTIFIGLAGCQGDLSKLPSEPLTLAKDGETNVVIVASSKATEPEKHAAKELAEFLHRVTGTEFPIIAESAASGKNPKIYVGWTEFADAAGIDASKLGEEEWIIRTVGDNLIITGGRPRGTLYGVYEFLEDQVGCHWLDRETEVIPDKPTLMVEPMDIQTKPWFWQRRVSSPTGTPDNKWNFMVRNKTYRYDFHGRGDFPPEGAFHRLDGWPRQGHSFSYFVSANDHFDAHPEYFSLVGGKRLPAYDGAGPGQLCLTNPETLRLTLENLRKFIARDRAESAEKGCPPPRVYKIGQNDKYDAHCQCAACQAIAKREGSEAGPLVEFMNAVAEDIEKDHPDILVETFAYNLTSPPPKNVRPRDNVQIGWCDVYSKCDGIRPLKHPYNYDNHDELVGWGKIAPRLAIGDDYWTVFGYYNFFPLPYEIASCVADDLKFFADQGCESFYAESQAYLESGQQFIPLKFWLAYQLLVDPHQPVEPLIKTFMKGYYGPAASKMREYLRYLRKRIDEDAQFKALREEPHKLNYLDVTFFKKSEELFDEAEDLAKSDGLAAKHVAMERFILDGALLYLWPWLERKLPPGEVMPFDHETVIKRYEKEWRIFVKNRFSRFYSANKLSVNKDGKLLERMTGLFRNPKLPEQFKNLPAEDVADFNWLTFSTVRPSQKFVADDEAAGGMAAEPAAMSAIQVAEKGGDKQTGDSFLEKPLCFGATGGPTVTLKPRDVPQDGAYHLHKLGRIRVKPGTVVWALDGKRLGVNVDRVFVPGADDPTENDWNAYVSLKVQGPAHVKGSTKPNGVWMDRVLLVKPQPGEQMDEAYKKQLKEERRRAALRPKLKVPKLTKTADGDPVKVDWTKAVDAGKWWTHKGNETDRDVSAKFAYDDNWLYLQLTERMDTKTPRIHPRIWYGDHWELLVAPQRDVKPYRQLAINPDEKFLELAYGEPKWESGTKVKSNIDDKTWTLNVALPLKNLVPDGAEPGRSFYLNLMRGGKENLFWSPVFGEKFHSLDRLGEVVLGPRKTPGIAEKVNNKAE